ncbi:MAG: 30S ribosomal protein S5 [Candidatus Magasanikbacteria bacterium CG10_big_fil_rev_8_21_14_0_10_43_6]|uniref:Small ribosomal subunit protein uS5 n=1 Tax=Candidatus Magasanikbacteria bacterium CG10_big_fil_rev_8_21_14_0_10_43_6 TaxID=1974650 RepID=A0A2M6W0C2_9BACT|nr:MAG: 30S ribosomal protein S5 [Candidatus Magasanikbacteria bacterium CG10_big_fil_rev_8_21_14_0_10_43_6]
MSEGRQGRGKFKKKREKPEFDQQIVDLARVTRVTKGGKQLNFRVCIVIGDRKGRVGYGIAKGADVQIAVGKAVNQAKKTMITVPFVKETVPHRVETKYKAAKVMIKPAPKGSGVIAGGATRVILELAGVPNASAKALGKTNNKVTNVRATFQALQSFLPAAHTRAAGSKKMVVAGDAPTKKVVEKKAETKKK